MTAYPYVSAFLHVSEERRFSSFSKDLSDAIYYVVELAKEIEPESECEIEITPKIGNSTELFKRFSNEGIHLHLCQKSSNISSVNVRVLSNHKKLISMRICIDRSESISVGIVKNEQSILYEIYKSFWKKNHVELMEMIKKCCAILPLSYACVDFYQLVPQSIYHGNIRMMGFQAEKVNPEEKIPGVYWAQFVSKKMFSSSGSLTQLVEKLSKDRISSCILNNSATEGLWIQTATSLEKDSLEDHICFLNTLIRSTYQLDKKQIERCIASPYSLKNKLPVQWLKSRMISNN